MYLSRLTHGLQNPYQWLPLSQPLAKSSLRVPCLSTSTLISRTAQQRFSEQSSEGSRFSSRCWTLFSAAGFFSFLTPISGGKETPVEKKFGTSVSSPSQNESFDCLLGNKDLSKSKVVFVVDPDHSSLAQKVSRIIFLTNQMKSGDVLLIEGIPFTEECDPRHYLDTTRIKKEVTVRGWEEKELYYSALASHLVLQTIVKEAQAAQTSDELEKCTQLFWIAFEQFVKDAIEERNKAMTRSIDKVLPTLKEGQRVFVVAGRMHFTKELLEALPNYSCVLLKDPGESS